MEEKKLDGSSSMTYSVYRQGSTSAILISEFDTNIENLKDKMYESAKVNLLKPQNSKIETEKDITINGISGKEFTTTDYYTYQKLRVFVKGNRVYLIMNDVTKPES